MTPPDAPVPPPSRPQPRVDARLRDRFAADPDARANVVVQFTTLPGEDELSRLGIAATGANPDVGSVDAAQFAELAGRSDVVSITEQPRHQLFR